MSLWDERVKTHLERNGAPLLRVGYGPAISSGRFPKRLHSDRANSGLINLFRQEASVRRPLLISPNVLEEIANFVGNGRAEVEGFKSNGNEGHLNNANVQVERTVAMSSQIPGLLSPEELQALIASSNEYRSIYDKKIEIVHSNVTQFMNERNALDVRLSALDDALNAERQKLLQLSTNYQSQFSAAQDSRSKEFTDAQGLRQALHGQLIAQFEKKLIEQNAEFTKKRAEIEAENENAVADLHTSFHDRADAILQSIEENQKKVEDLVGVIGNLGVTSGYLRTANSARKSMWFWQSLTVLALGTLSVLAYKTLSLLEDGKGHFNWGGFDGRVVLLMSLGVIAAYSGNQADKFFTDEKRNRKLDLELEAIGP